MNPLGSSRPLAADEKTAKDVNSKVKTVNEILDEFEALNPEYYSGGDILKIRKLHAEVVKSYNEQWKTAREASLQRRAKEFRALGSSFKSSLVPEVIAMLDRTFEILNNGHRLRASQVLTLLLLCGEPNNDESGIMCEIQPDEGKTILAVMLAIIKVFLGEGPVDIISPNGYLAICGYRENLKYFSFFNIEVAYIPSRKESIDNSDPDDPDPCYKADVLYGTLDSFQSDYLRDISEGATALSVRSSRPFQTLILDGIEPMLMDENQIYTLSIPPFGADQLKHIYTSIWLSLVQTEKDLRQKMALELEEEIMKIRKRAQAGELSETAAVEAEMSSKDKLRLRNHSTIESLVRESATLALKQLPRHLQQFVETSRQAYVDNAIEAKYALKKNEDYFIRRETEEVVLHTPGALSELKCNQGLLQFLQLKHRLPLTTEDFRTFSISNWGYLQLYDSNVFGLTDSLGSKEEEQLLQDLYKVRMVKVPTFEVKNFNEYTTVISRDADWAMDIAAQAKEIAVTQRRAVLVACSTISDCNATEEALKTINVSVRMHLDQPDHLFTNENLGIGDVVVISKFALTSRGFKFNTLPESGLPGGLHVILGFLPLSERFKQQAISHARRHKNGSYQILIKASEVMNSFRRWGRIITSKNELVWQDEEERKNLNSFGSIWVEIENVTKELKMDELKKLKYIWAQSVFQDQLFRELTKYYGKFKQLTLFKPEFEPPVHDLLESWTLWNSSHNFTITSRFKEKAENEGLDVKVMLLSWAENCFKGYEATSGYIMKDGKSGSQILQNPWYSFEQAQFFISQDKFEEAGEAITNGIELAGGDIIFYASALFTKDATWEYKRQAMLESFKMIFDKYEFLTQEASLTSELCLRVKEDLLTLKQKLKGKVLSIRGEMQAGLLPSNFTILSEDSQSDLTNAGINSLISEILTKSSSVSTRRQFRIVDLEDTSEFCSNMVQGVIYYIVMDVDPSTTHWVSICTRKNDKSITALVVGPSLDNEFESVLEDAWVFNAAFLDVDFKLHPQKLQIPVQKTGLVSLENLRIMAEEVSRTSFKDLDEHFHTVTFFGGDYCPLGTEVEEQKESSGYMNNIKHSEFEETIEECKREWFFQKQSKAFLFRILFHLIYIERQIQKSDRNEPEISKTVLENILKYFKAVERGAQLRSHYQ